MSLLQAALDKPSYQPGDTMTLTVQVDPPPDSRITFPIAVAVGQQYREWIDTLPAWRETVMDTRVAWRREAIDGTRITYLAEARESGTVTALLEWLGGSAEASVDYNVTRAFPVLLGATAMPGPDTAATVKAFPGIRYMRDFGKDTGDPDSLPELPPHGAGKWLAKPPGCLLHVSWKDDPEQLGPWLDGLAEDIYLTWWHEPMGDMDPAAYRTAGERVAHIIAAHPNGRRVLRHGPIVTRYWLASKGGDPLDWWYPGASMYGVDVYNDSKVRYREPDELFGIPFAIIRRILPGVPLVVPEFGLALIDGDTGAGRAAVMARHADWLRGQPDLLAVGWWDIGGNRICGREPEQGVWRSVLAGQGVSR